jgi:hypothetical protein
MANTTITNLPLAVSLNGGEQIPAVNTSSTTVRLTVQQISNYVSASQTVTPNNALTATANAATVLLVYPITTITNSSAAPLTITITTTKPQFDRNRHGSLYDRGSADSYYGRGHEPHWYPEGTYNGSRIVNLTEEEIAEYNQGYDDNEKDGNKKEW